jgi:hypothetical protein
MEEKKKAIMPSLQAMDNRFLKREGEVYLIIYVVNQIVRMKRFYFILLY